MSPSEALVEAYSRHVVPTYSRFPIVIQRGAGSRLWDQENREYLDFGTGIAVNTLGHAHPAMAEALYRQAQNLIHTSNLYYTEPQVRVAETVVQHTGPGKCFFCNSGAEANEALFKLARKFGNGRYEVITTLNSFHGRTLATIAATGQDKVKAGYDPAVEGFRHVPFNDLPAMEQAISDKTAAILIEGVQGEGGIRAASTEYLMGLRRLCDEKKILLMMDAVQCGMFRTGKFQSFQRILESTGVANFLPDAISMAKGIAGGVPMGLIWVREPFSTILGAGSHGSTFGGTPLACAAALAVFETVKKEGLAENARVQGDYLAKQLRGMNSPHVQEVRGLGLIMGFELKTGIPSLQVEGKTPAALFVQRLHDHGLMLIPSGNQVLRILPPLTVNRAECDEALDKIQRALKEL